MNLYETIDTVFDELFNLYGLTDKLIQMKGEILNVYENEAKYKSNEILKIITPKTFYIDRDGMCVLVNYDNSDENAI